MAGTSRILIVDRNRYHALLLDRQIHDQLERTVTTIMRSIKDALVELSQNTYSVVVVDYSLLHVASVEVSEISAVGGNELGVILTVPPGTILPNEGFGKEPETNVVIKDSTFHLQIPPLIDYFRQHGSFVRDGRQIRPRRNIRRKADMINITAGTLAHEINNPLMTILGVSELILTNGSGCPPEVIEKVQVIQKSARRIDAVLSHLASLSEPNFLRTAGGQYIETPVDPVSK